MAIDHLLKVTKQNLRQADDGNKLKETEALKSFIEEIEEVDDNKISINSLQQQLLEEKRQTTFCEGIIINSRNVEGVYVTSFRSCKTTHPKANGKQKE